MPYHPMIPYITIAIVISGLLITLKQLNLKSKESIQLTNNEILSKNRQDWINTLRNELANFIGLIRHIEGYTRLSTQPTNEGIENLQLSVKKLQESQAKINLLINPDEIKHQKLVSLIDNLITQVTQVNNEESLHENEKLLVSTSQSILKEEWERVKNFDTLPNNIKKQTFTNFIGEMIIKLITIIVISFIYIFYKKYYLGEEININTIANKLDYILAIWFSVIIISTVVINAFVKNKMLQQISSIFIKTSFSTVYVAFGYICTIAFYTLIGSSIIDKEIKIIYLGLFSSWILIVFFTWFLNYILEKTYNTKNS